MIGVVGGRSDVPAATDVFVGATCQAEIDARIGDFIAFLEDRGVAVEHGTAVYASGVEPPVKLEGWTFIKTRNDQRAFAVARSG